MNFKTPKNTIDTILNEAYSKYNKHQKITYEEYVIMLTTNDEIWFWYDEKEYQVAYFVPNKVTMCVTKYSDGNVIFEHDEHFSSIIDMLSNFRIDGNLIKDIWSKVSF